MTDKMKQYLGWAIIISVLLVAFSAVGYVRVYSRQVSPGGYRSFSVSGDGKAVVVPDIAEFSFSVITDGGTDLATLQTQNTDKVNKAISYVKSQGIADKDIQTSGYNIQPRYQTSNCYRTLNTSTICPPAEIVGYSVNQSVAVKARDFSKVGTILAGVVERGANSVPQLNFTVDDPTQVENEARAQAIDKAKAKAEGIAKAGGFSLGRLISIEENGPGPVYYDKAMAYGVGGGVAASAPAPTIEPGSQEFNVTMNLVYEIN